MTIETNDQTVVISGEVNDFDAARCFPKWTKNSDYFQVVDLSKAHFVEYEYTSQRCYGMGHSRLMYGRGTTTRKVDSFMILLEHLYTGTVLLPPDVSRKHLNACIRCETIGRIVVTDDCKLFSMKDGSVWNKKGTILIHEQKGPLEFVRCEGCGRSFFSSAGGKTVDGGLVCPDCQRRSEFVIGTSGRYIPFEGLFYLENDPRLAEQLSKAGTNKESYLWILRNSWKK